MNIIKRYLLDPDGTPSDLLETIVGAIIVWAAAIWLCSALTPPILRY